MRSLCKVLGIFVVFLVGVSSRLLAEDVDLERIVVTPSRVEESFDDISRKVPTLCKVAPSSSYHIEDVHRAGGVLAILEELMNENLLNENELTISGLTIKEQIKDCSITKDENPGAHQLYLSGIGGQRTI